MWRLLLQTYFNFFVIGYAIDLLALVNGATILLKIQNLLQLVL